MFFPKLSRREENYYHHSQGGFYADYTKNHQKISEDCQHRCVYCDVRVDEIGGEGMHLDHFRPQHYFSTLTTHPHNLYLACAKCNQLKSKDWPCSKVLNGPSFVDSIGYIDAFTHDPKDYLKVDVDGHIVQIDGPVNYMIKKLALNRLSRTQIRRKRFLEKRKIKVLESMTEMTKELDLYINTTSTPLIAEIQKRLTLIREVQSLFQATCFN